MSMYNVLAITNRNLCKGDFLDQIKKICILNNEIKKHRILKNTDKKYNHMPNIADSNNECLKDHSINIIENDNSVLECSYGLNNINSISIVLREKDLSEEEYEKLALKVIKICEEYNTECILHTYYNTAKKISLKKIHLPLSLLKNNPNIIHEFDYVGISVHSIEDSLMAQDLGASYITAGHIFDTDCKKGLPGKGLPFLTSIVNSVHIPVFAIGGITSSNINEVINAGAYGVCIMSGLMTINNPKDFLINKDIH